MDRTTGKEFVEENEFNFIPVIVAVALVLITLVVLFLIKRRQLQRTDVLLAGLCDSGKTLLYSLILNGSEIETFTSLKENLGILTLPKGTARLVDLPGHERLRLRLLDTYKSYTKALVYVIDSSVIQKEVKDVADFLYTLLADKALSSVPVLVLCNKQDETMSKGKAVIEQLLEKEINLIRKTRTSQLKSVDNSQDTTAFLGRADRDFDFTQISQKITFAESSAKNNDIEQLTNFINSL